LEGSGRASAIVTEAQWQSAIGTAVSRGNSEFIQVFCTEVLPDSRPKPVTVHCDFFKQLQLEVRL
jgi:hypothetical protein